MVTSLGLLECILRLLIPGVRLLLVDLRLMYSKVKRLRAIWRVWVMAMDLLLTAVNVMLNLILRVRRLHWDRLLATSVQVWRDLHRGSGIERSRVGCTGIVLLKDQLHAYTVEFVRLVGVVLCLRGPLVSAGILAPPVVFVGLGNDQGGPSVLGFH